MEDRVEEFKEEERRRELQKQWEEEFYGSDSPQNETKPSQQSILKPKLSFDPDSEEIYK